MDSPKKIDVADWKNSPQPILRKTVRRRFLPPTLIGILGTLLLHAMFIQSVSFGSRRIKLQLPETQDSADVQPKSTKDSDSLVLIELPMTAKASQDTRTQSLVSSLPELSKMKVKSRIDVDSPAFLGLESLALSEDEVPNALADAENSGEQARLFGIYTGQIQARIDRVWRRPRTPVNEANVDARESFQCEAQIMQDAKGNVTEILLPRCNGSFAWQRSLILAIQQASPLPAPPSEKVFRTSISLEFLGLSYFSGAPEDGYELASQTLLSAQ